jgi:F-type H+-transporting ATPase subunit delta
MALSSKRYAEALLKLALINNKVGDFRSQVAYIAQIYKSNEDIRNFLLNPHAGKAFRKNIIIELFTDYVDKELINMLFLLIDKEKLAYIPNLSTEYMLLADKHEKVLNVIVTSSSPLDEIQLLHLKHKYENLFNANLVTIEATIDSTLIGGLTVQIGDKVYDGSLKGRLESLKDILFDK